MRTRRLAPALLLWLLLIPSSAVAEQLAQGAEILAADFDWAKESPAQALARVEKDVGTLSRVLALAPGYPKILTHAEFAEIEPDSPVVALGICIRTLSHKPLKVLYDVSARAWGLELQQPRTNAECPRLVEGWEHGQKVSPKVDGHLLSAVQFVRPGAAGTEEPGAVVEVHLRRRSAELEDAKELLVPKGCTASLSADRDVIRVEKTCVAPAKPGKEILRFRAANGKIVPAGGLESFQELRAVVWGGGGTEAAAQAALMRWEKEKGALPRTLTMPAGYPRIVKGDDYPGLPSGERLVLLGVCPAEWLEAPLWTLQMFQPRVTAVKVKVAGGEPACPTMDEKLRAKDVEVARLGALRLTVAQYGRDPWLVVAYLRDSNGDLLDWRADDEKTISVRGRCYEVLDLAVPVGKSQDRVQLELQCESPDDEVQHSFTGTVTYSATSGKITATMKTTKPKTQLP